MALKITLKPNEKMIVDGAVITNGAGKTVLYIENNVPVLRQKDILTEKDADSPARRIYFVIQLMYIDEANLPRYHKQYWRLVKDFIQAAPSRLPVIDKISGCILESRYYQALKWATQLIEYEQEATRRVSESTAGVSVC